MSKSNNNKLPTFKKLILDELKSKNLNGVIQKINSIRYSSFSMGDAVDVHSTDLVKSEREQLEGILKEYQSGSFNSWDDIYEYRKEKSRARTAKYVHLHNQFSSEVKEKVKKDLEENFQVTDYQSSWSNLGCDYETAVHRKLFQLEEI